MGPIIGYPAAKTGDGTGRIRAWQLLAVCLAFLAAAVPSNSVFAQENPLGTVETKAPPPPPKSPEDSKPVIEGSADVVSKATSHPEARLRVNVNLVQVPMTVTDPMNRLVTGLEKENFALYDNNVGQSIRYFASEEVRWRQVIQEAGIKAE